MNSHSHSPQKLFSIIEQRCFHKQPISAELARQLAALPEPFTLDILALAKLAHRAHGPNATTFTCGISNAKSGRCSQDCAFCAQSRYHDTEAPVYPLISSEKLVQQAKKIADAGAKRFGIVTSGHTVSDEELTLLSQAIRQIQAETPLQICASLGQLTRSKAQQLKVAGVTSYHHNLETARSFFPSICTTHAYDEDITTVRTALAAGFRVCCGGILGMGENWNQRIELSETLRSLNVPSVPINFLSPIRGTRLEKRSTLSPLEALKCIAIFRLMLPKQDILIAGGREATLKEYQSWLFMAGANGIMIGNYLTTSGRDTQADKRMLQDLGLH